MKSISQWRQETTRRLKPVADDLAAFESYRMLGHLMNCGPTELTLRSSDTLTPEQEDRLQRFITDRLTGRPLAYVLGHAFFGGLDLLCDSRAMIPRPESEEMLELALSFLPDSVDGIHPVIIDVGTGSGNLALSMAHARPDVRVIATDIKWPALELAGENRVRLGFEERVRRVCGRSLSMFARKSFADMIISNPPYVAVGNPFIEKSVVDFEPHSALFAGPDGMEIIRELFAAAADILRPQGWFVSEIGYDQGDLVRDMVRSAGGWETPVLHRDMADIERVVAVRRSP